MDAETQARLDSLLEDEVRRGYRIKDVPENLQMQLKVDGLPALERVRFTRLNPRRKSKIADAVQRRYHRDLKDPDILSNEQIAKLVHERGEWTAEQDRQMYNLIGETQQLQTDLYADGIGDSNWNLDMLEASKVLRAAVDTAGYSDPTEKKQVLAILDRWSEYMPAERAAYTVLYAADQGTEQYSPDKDLSWLMDRMPSQDATDALELLDDLRDKAVRFITLQDKSKELALLQNRHARIFADSVESRRDQSEEMARVYFCTERADANDNPIGPLAATLDELWDFPEEVIRWLIIEHYFFANGLSDAARDYLETFGFLKADRDTNEETLNAAGDSTPSVESPDPQSFRDGLIPRTETAASSSE